MKLPASILIMLIFCAACTSEPSVPTQQIKFRANGIRFDGNMCDGCALATFFITIFNDTDKEIEFAAKHLVVQHNEQKQYGSEYLLEDTITHKRTPLLTTPKYVGEKILPRDSLKRFLILDYRYFCKNHSFKNIDSIACEKYFNSQIKRSRMLFIRRSEDPLKPQKDTAYVITLTNTFAIERN